MPRSTAELLAHADALADAFENLDPNEGTSRVTGLGELYLAVQDRAASERRLSKAVAAARADGTSWGLIGRMVGTTGEAARQRFAGGGLVRKTTKQTAKKAIKKATKKAVKAVPAKAATTKATPAKKASKSTTKSSDYALTASAGRRQPTGRTVTRDARSGRVGGAAQPAARRTGTR